MKAGRREFSLAALTLLTGCDDGDHDNVRRLLARFSVSNDRVQAALFGPDRLTPEYPERQSVGNFRYTAWGGPEKAPRLDSGDYRLDLSGLIAEKRLWSVAQLHALPHLSQVTRHVCVEGWCMIGKWGGTPLRTFRERIGADTTTAYVRLECGGGYCEAIDKATALHPQTLMAFRLANEILPMEDRIPFEIRVLTWLGFKNPKFVTTIHVSNRQRRGSWSDRGYNWFSGP